MSFQLVTCMYFIYINILKVVGWDFGVTFPLNCEQIEHHTILSKRKPDITGVLGKDEVSDEVYFAKI